MQFVIGIIVLAIILYFLSAYQTFFFIVSILGVIIGAVYWRSRKNSVIFFSSVALLIVTAISSWFFSSHPTSSSSTKTEASSSTPTASNADSKTNNSNSSNDAASKQQYQNEFKSFKQAINDKDNEFNPFVQDAQKALKSGDPVTIYQAIKAEQNKAKELQLYFATDPATPDDLPDNVKSLLNDAKQSLSTSYFTRGEGLGYSLQYLDEQKPSLISKSKDDSDMANNFQLDAAAKLIDAGNKLGLTP